MNDMLLKFLVDNEDQADVWFLVPSGLISGKLQTLESKEPETIVLANAVVYIGNKPVEVEVATILIPLISAWGNGFVTPRK